MKKAFANLKKKVLIPWRKFKTLSLKHKIVTVVIIIIASTFLLQTISNLTKPSPFTLERVRRENITEIVTESGNIIASGRMDVFSPTNGVVTDVFVTNGSWVKKGDKLFSVESSATEQEANAAYANYLSAVATLNAAQSTANILRATMFTQWKTFTDLATNSTYEKGDDTPNLDNRKSAEFQASQDTWIATEKKYKDQQTVIAQANALVSSTWSLYQATQNSTVTAQSDGTVTNLSVTKGSPTTIKSVSIAGTASTPSLILQSEGLDEVLLLLSETDIAKVKPGQKTKISVNAVSNKIYNGSVERVDSIGTDNQGVVTYNAYVNITDGDDFIRHGMTVDADITTNELKNELSVTNSAVKPYQGGRAVRVPDASKEKFRYVPVAIGVRGNTRTQILKGIEEGQEVITSVSNENIKRSGLFGN